MAKTKQSGKCPALWPSKYYILQQLRCNLVWLTLDWVNSNTFNKVCNCWGDFTFQLQEETHALLPPKTRKEALFDEKKFKKVDKLATQVPPRFLKKNVGSLVDRLMKNAKASDDLSKVRAIFVWFTRLDLNAIYQKGRKDFSKPPSNSALEWVVKLKANRTNHAHFFKMLCRLVSRMFCSQVNIEYITITCLSTDFQKWLSNDVFSNNLGTELSLLLSQVFVKYFVIA